MNTFPLLPARARWLMIPFSLILSACASTPASTGSAMVKIEMSGFLWEKTKSAEAGFVANIQAPDRLPFYAEVTLPNPDGKPEVIRSLVKKGDASIKAKGMPRSGWRDQETYYFMLKIYSDPGYTHLLDILTQSSVFHPLPPSPADSPGKTG